MNWYKKARYGGAETERSIWYHGTRGRNLPKILAEGLLPFPKTRSWQSDPNASIGSPSKKSLGGIYLTKNLMTARSSALRNKDDNEDMIIVTIEAQPRSFLMDEDSISNIVQSSIKLDNVLPNEWLLSELAMAKLMNSNDDYVQTTKNTYIQKTLETIKFRFKVNPRAESTLVNTLKNGWETALNRQSAYIDDRTWRTSFYRNLSQEMNTNLNKKSNELRKQYGDEIGDKKYEEYINSLIPARPNKQKAETDYANFVDKLTRILKSSAIPSKEKDTFNPTARIEENIGFSGSNKIICILSENKKREVKLIYGTIPEQLKQDWNMSVGELELI